MFFSFASGFQVSVIRDSVEGFEVAVKGNHTEPLLDDYFDHYSEGNGWSIYRFVPIAVLKVVTTKHELFDGKETCSKWSGTAFLTANYPTQKAAQQWLDGLVNVNACSVLA